MAVLAVVNQKGGVGKTTVALGLAAAAAAHGRSVVVVDLDPQANATSGMAVWNPQRTVATALMSDRPGSMNDVIVDSGWDPSGFEVIPRIAPSEPALAQLEPQMAIDPIGAQDRLAQSLIGVEADLVIVDCPPSLGLLTVNGLFAADAAAIVTEPGSWAVDGVAQILRNIERVAARRGGAPVVAGIVVNRLGRTRDARYWDAELLAAHPELVVRPAIALKAAVAEASAQSVALGTVRRTGAAESLAQFGLVLGQLLERVPGADLGPGRSASVDSAATPGTTGTDKHDNPDVTDDPTPQGAGHGDL